MRSLRLLAVFTIIFLSFGCISYSTSQAGIKPDDSSVAPDWIHLSSADGDLPEPGNNLQQTASLILDVNKDGILDFVIGSRKLPGPSMVWYQRDNGGWTRRTIDPAALNIEAGGAYYDIDSDGDLDVVMGGDNASNKVWWWENPYPNYESPWARREIKSTGSNKHHDQIFGDFDGDGQVELVFWNQGAKKLFLAEIPTDPKNTQPWNYSAVYSWSSGPEHEGLAKADIDGDGVEDIVGGGRWFKHSGDTNYTANIIDSSQTFSRAAAGQLKSGGRPEAVFVVGDGTGRLKWYEWTGTSWEGHDLLGFNVDHGHSLQVEDINGDGYLDVFNAEMRLGGGNPDAKMWVFLGDGSGKFTKTEVATGYGNHESRVGDLDGDGDLDILGKPYRWETPRVDIWLNNKAGISLENWERQVIDDSRPWRSIFVTSGDLNSDGHEDIITGGWWYQNPGDSNGNWIRHDIGSPLNNMAAVYDFDGDNDLDILGTSGQGSNPNDTFVWAQNNGSGQFAILDNINHGDGDFLQGAAVERFKNGELGVALSWHQGGKGVQQLTTPEDPVTQTWSWSQISPVSQDEALSSGDIDKDGDPDLLLGTKWLRNDDAGWTEFDLYLPNGMPDRNQLADINSDGSLDAVVGYESVSKQGKLAWYEQGTEATDLWEEHIIADPAIIGPMSLDVADMDADGDLDIVVGEHNTANPSSASLYVFENLDGSGGSWTRHLVNTGDEHHDGAQVVDIDNDGDLDIISIGWTHNRVVLYKNKSLNFTSRLFLPLITENATDDVAVAGTCTPKQSPLALYTFNEGRGKIVHDVSGTPSDLDLMIREGDVQWLDDGGISINSPALITSIGPANKLVDAIRQTNQFTVDVWIKPDNVDQDGPARIITLSADTQNRNFTLGQGLWNDQPSELFDVRLRTSQTNNNGLPSLTTRNGSAGTELTHLVYVHQQDGKSFIYVDSAIAASEQTNGDLSNWDSDYRLALANELDGGRPWLGEFYRIAIYGCALNPDELNGVYNPPGLTRGEFQSGTLQSHKCR